MSILRLLTLDLRLEHDVVHCRQRARQLATAFGFDTAEQTRIATAVSEIARNAYDYAKGGKIEFAVETPSRPAASRKETPRQSFVITVRDQGPGLPPVGQRHSPNGLGIGLTGAGRLMDAMDIATRPGATAITMRKTFPTGAPLFSSAQLQGTVDRITAERPTDPLGELQRQNQELLRALEEVSLREEDLARVNQELADTNTGVLALYDELETLQKVSVLLSTQLDLKTLLHAIIDATTELTGARFGAFYQRDPTDGAWRLQALSGAAAGVLDDLPMCSDEDYFGEEFLAQCVIAWESSKPETCGCEGSKFARALAPRFDPENCQTIPVLGASGVLNAMVFGGGPGAFTERNRRIVASIASQAAIGIEKARLFAEVQSASAAKDRFLAMLSHELRTPLNPVLMAAGELHDDPALPPAMRDTLRMMQRNIALEARLIDDLLDFSRITNGKLQLHCVPLDLHALVHAVVEICAEDISASHHTVTLDLQAPQATVFGDPARLQQVFWNLLKNAIKFTASPGRIEVRTRQSDGGTLTLTVADDGVGIEQSKLAEIFGAFEQGGDGVTARFGGLGLGLAITKAFVELHDGRIQAASDGPGKGTRITVELPLLTEEATTTPQATTTAQAVSPASTGTLLLIDDHADTLQVMARLLKRKGYQVLLATDCRSALEAARRGSFDLIVSDLGLPDGSGLTLLGQLRHHIKAPAIALSGYGMEEDLQQSRAAGYDEHLTKPIDFPLLVHTIGRLLAPVVAD